MEKELPCVRNDLTVPPTVSQIPAQLMLRMERCWATPTSDPYSNIQYTFIRDRYTLCPFLRRCRRSASCGDLCPRRAAGCLASDHWSVWEAVASLQTFLPSAGGAAHPVQHSPHLRGGLMNQGVRDLVGLLAAERQTVCIRY